MRTIRREEPSYTEIICLPDGMDTPWNSYRIVCMNIDITADGERVQPTARLSLLAATSATIETARLLAKEYSEVADLAEQLQNEKRAVYWVRFGEGA